LNILPENSIPPKIRAPGRWRVSWAISKRVIQAAIYSPTIYVGLAIITFAVIIPLRSFETILNDRGAIVVLRPFDLSILVAGILIAIYLAFFSLLAITQDRDQGTMVVLFYGPIDPESYLMGQLVGQWLQSLFIHFVLGLCIIILSLATGLVSSWQLGISLLASLITSATVISFGIFLGILVQKTRGAILLFTSFVAIIIILQVIPLFLTGLAAQGLGSINFLVNILSGLRIIVRWVSPFSYLFNGLDAASRGDYITYLLALIQAIVYMLVLLLISARVLKRRGIQP
jgi:ABC-type transport system involved in multi-copper enzyme maturation permease subunit